MCSHHHTGTVIANTAGPAQGQQWVVTRRYAHVCCALLSKALPRPVRPSSRHTHAPRSAKYSSVAAATTTRLTKKAMSASMSRDLAKAEVTTSSLRYLHGQDGGGVNGDWGYRRCMSFEPCASRLQSTGRRRSVCVRGWGKKVRSYR